MGQCYADRRENGSWLPDSFWRTMIIPARILPECVTLLHFPKLKLNIYITVQNIDSFFPILSFIT